MDAAIVVLAEDFEEQLFYKQPIKIERKESSVSLYFEKGAPWSGSCYLTAVCWNLYNLYKACIASILAKQSFFVK